MATCFNSLVRTGCVVWRGGFWRRSSVSILMCAQIASYTIVFETYQGKDFNSHVRTDCIGSTVVFRLFRFHFNSHVRTDCISKNRQKPLLITINLAQLYCLNSSAHSILLAIKGDLLLLHRCEPPTKSCELILRAHSIRTLVRISIISDHSPKVKFHVKEKSPEGLLNLILFFSLYFLDRQNITGET